MIRNKRLNDDGVAKLKPAAKRVSIPDPELRGHYIRITPNGSKSFWVVARDSSGKQHWRRLGEPPMSIAESRLMAMKAIDAIRTASVIDAGDAGVSFEAISAQWFRRVVIKNEFRSERMIRGLLKNHIVPAFAGMNFVDVRRKHVTALLDRMEDHQGARSADYALSVVKSICDWYAMRDEDYSSPIVKGMGRRKKKDRERILRDREIAELWEADGLFGNLTKFALLTAQRKDKIMFMRWDDVRGGVWHITSAEREKGTGESLRLPALALQIIEAQRQINSDSPFVFADRTGSPRSKIARAKKAFEKAYPMPHWTIHDLRRTARSLMAKAEVPTVHAELVMGHKQRGVIGIYDRHDYADEKAHALKALAGAIRDIVTPPPSNVIALQA
jgi:integrase